MVRLSSDQKTAMICRFLSVWKNTTRKYVSLDADTYGTYFPEVPISHTVHDQSNNPILIIVDREEAIRIASQYSSLHLGKELNLKDGTYLH